MARQKLRPMPETEIINRVDSTCCNQLSLFTINIAHHVYNNHVVITSLKLPIAINIGLQYCPRVLVTSPFPHPALHTVARPDYLCTKRDVDIEWTSI